MSNCHTIKRMKQSKCFLNLIITTFLIILCLTSLVSCTFPIPSDTELQAAYRNAVADAKVVDPDEICCNLEAIVYYNPYITWEGQPGASRILVVTWTGWDGYDGTTGKTMSTSRDTWVVLPKKLKYFFKQNRSLGGDRLTLRLEQLYGLPPHNGKKWLVEMWANPDDIFRPSPDPEITDHEAELDFPKWVDNP